MKDEKGYAPITIAALMLGATVVSDIICVAVILLAHAIDTAGGGRDWTDYALWKFLPVVVLINVIYFLWRGLVWLNERQEKRGRRSDADSRG
jgi:Kef-type K+ transport system membrane component KefB